MPELKLIRLSKVATELHFLGFDQANVLEFLRAGTLRAIIKYPGPTDTYEIPKTIWQNMPTSIFSVRRYERIGGKRHRRAVSLYIDIDFAIQEAIEHLKQLIQLANSRDERLFAAQTADLHLPVEIRKNRTTPADWTEVHSALVNRLAAIAGESERSRRVYIETRHYREFRKENKIPTETRAGRNRLPFKDQIWAECLARYYVFTPPSKLMNTRISEIVEWVAKEHKRTISWGTIENMFSAIDRIAESHSEQASKTTD
jgi:hypothetical protein